MLVNDGKIYNGETQITKVYQGTDVIYEAGEQPEHIEVNYLESTGTQYIDTGVAPTVYHKIELDMQFTDNTASTGTRLFGSRRTWNQKGFYGGTSANQVGRNWWFQLGSSYYEVGLASDMNRHLISFAKTLYIDGVYKYNFVNSAQFIAYKNIMLFGSFDGDNSTTEVSKTAYKLYSCKLYYNNELVKDLIPVKKKDGTLCLYDKLNDEYLYNAGTGTFLYG